MTHHNIGTSMRDTAVVTKNGITLNNVSKLPSGRTVAAEYRGTWLINLYAPSGTARRHKREKFYNNELTYLLRSSQAKMILGGDFSCVLANSDTTDQYHYSRALAELIHGFALQNTWQQNPASPTYTHHSITGSTRIDRLHTTQELLAKKLGTEILDAAFTDHHAVMLRIAVDTPILRMDRGRWKMNTAMFRDERILHGMRHKWALRKHHKRYYARATLWCVRYVKKKLRSFVRYEEAERRNDLRQMENYFYACIYDILRSYMPQEDNWPALKRYKAKMVKLHTDGLNTVRQRRG